MTISKIHQSRLVLLLIGGALASFVAANVRAAPPSPPDGTPAITFSRDVAPLIYANCTTCHREGEAAPFPLITYQDVRKHAKHIVEVTNNRLMPPWKPERGCGEFLGERRLTDAQVALLARWAGEGCPEGGPAAAPQPPKFTDGWQLGKPDLVVTMAEPYALAAEGRDVYRCFVISVDVPPGKYLRAAEYRPGNRRIVHHAVLTTLPQYVVRQKLAAEPAGTGPGFRTGLAAPGERLAGPMGIWTPGHDALPMLEGYAMPWPKGCDLALQLHLHPDGKPETEQSSVGLYFTDEPPRGALRPVLLFNRKVDIPPGRKDYKLAASVTLPKDVEVVGLFPHMHLLGRTVKATATLPDGTVLPMLSIGDWDFRWQNYYQYATPLRLPAGTRLDAEWTFDNSAENPANPSTPPKRVRFGEQTVDEMGAIVLDVIAARGDGAK